MRSTPRRPDQVKVLLAMVIEEVTTKDRVIEEIRLRPEAMPFFAFPDPVLVFAPPDGLRGSEAKAPDPLAWYAVSPAIQGQSVGEAVRQSRQIRSPSSS